MSAGVGLSQSSGPGGLAVEPLPTLRSQLRVRPRRLLISSFSNENACQTILSEPPADKRRGVPPWAPPLSSLAFQEDQRHPRRWDAPTSLRTVVRLYYSVRSAAENVRCSTDAGRGF